MICVGQSSRESTRLEHAPLGVGDVDRHRVDAISRCSASPTRFRTSSRLPWTSSRWATSTSWRYERAARRHRRAAEVEHRRGAGASAGAELERASPRIASWRGERDSPGARQRTGAAGSPQPGAELLLRGLLRRLQRVQHLLLDVGRGVGERSTGLPQNRCTERGGACTSRGRAQREGAVPIGADVDGGGQRDVVTVAASMPSGYGGALRYLIASPMRSQRQARSRSGRCRRRPPAPSRPRATSRGPAWGWSRRRTGRRRRASCPAR